METATVEPGKTYPMIVEVHGGSITVVSKPGMGTAFTITLPVGSARHQPVAAAADGLDPDRGVQLAT